MLEQLISLLLKGQDAKDYFQNKPLGDDGMPLPNPSLQGAAAMGQNGVLPQLGQIQPVEFGVSDKGIGRSLAALQAEQKGAMPSQGIAAKPFENQGNMIGAERQGGGLNLNSGASTQPFTGGMTNGSTNWGQLFNPMGNATEPNALVRTSMGYNDGGLLGALGYLLTDMTRKGNPTQQRQNQNQY